MIINRRVKLGIDRREGRNVKMVGEDQAAGKNTVEGQAPKIFGRGWR